MFTIGTPTSHTCDAHTVKGTECRGIAHVAVWCHGFEDWSNSGQGPSWWDVCNVHQSVPRGYVSSMPLPLSCKPRSWR